MPAKPTRTPSEATQMAVMANDLGYVRKAVDTLSDKIDNNYVTKEEFKTVKQIVYGFVTLILAAVVSAILALVLRSK